MKSWLLNACVALFLVTQPVAAQEVVAPDAGIETAIQSQIDAFLAGDVVTAFGFASPMIQGMFRTPENFGMMVQRGYPMVWQPSDVEFGDLRRIDGALWQMVTVRDADGALHVLGYRMEQQNGDWRISGVQILPQPDVAA